MAVTRFPALQAGPPSLRRTATRRSPLPLPAKSRSSLRALSSPRLPVPPSHSSPISPQPRRALVCHCTPPEDSATATSGPNSSPPPPSGLLRRASSIAAATVASKILGFIREIVVAAVVGVGPVATAFNHAAMLPRFSTSFLGGVNGPIHLTVATVLSKASTENRRQLIRKMHFIVLLIGGALAVLTYIYAESIILISAPGLSVLTEVHPIKEMAVTQLKLMTPCILVAGSLGIGFGGFTAEGDDLIPSLSPSITSVAIIASIMVCVFVKRYNICNMDSALTGAFVSFGVTVGALIQWIIQVFMHRKTGYISSSISWKDFFKNKEVRKLIALMFPAISSSAMVQLTGFTDLYFSSFIPGSAAGLSYAHVLAMAPLGILSSAVVLPMLPLFSSLSEPSSWASLKHNLQKAILLCMVIILPVTCATCVMAGPVISAVFQRFKFDSAASSLVSSLLVCYSLGSPFWVIRELLAAVFYSLGDGNWPFLVTMGAVFMNVILDFLSVFSLGFGAQGLALSTSCVTGLSVLALLLLLSKKIRGLNHLNLKGPLFLLLACCIFSGFTTLICYRVLRFPLAASFSLRYDKLAELLSIFLAYFIGMSAFYLPLIIFQFPEVILIRNLLKTLINREMSDV